MPETCLATVGWPPGGAIARVRGRGGLLRFASLFSLPSLPPPPVSLSERAPRGKTAARARKRDHAPTAWLERRGRGWAGRRRRETARVSWRVLCFDVIARRVWSSLPGVERKPCARGGEVRLSSEQVSSVSVLCAVVCEQACSGRAGFSSPLFNQSCSLSPLALLSKLCLSPLLSCPLRSSRPSPQSHKGGDSNQPRRDTHRRERPFSRRDLPDNAIKGSNQNNR
jgi:hypothetical protein